MKPVLQQASHMRVAIVSASRSQRESLKSLIEEFGPQVIGVSNFRDYEIRNDMAKPDVLLVDLDHADDDALQRLERLVESSRIPILFNESTSVPSTPGPYRDDWVNNLVGKLHQLAFNPTSATKLGLLNRPKFGKTNTFALPRVLVISRSKTRRRVLQLILEEQGIKDTKESAFNTELGLESIAGYDVVLIDEHNVGPDEQTVFDVLKSQKNIPVHICNSSKIPPTVQERRKWGIQLAGELIKVKKLTDAALIIADKKNAEKILTARAPANDVIAPQESERADEPWGERLAQSLANVRASIAQNTARNIKNRKTSGANTDTTGRNAAGENAQNKVNNSPEKNSAKKPKVQKNHPTLRFGGSIVEQVDARIQESKQERTNLEQHLDDIRNDLRYMPPERAAKVQQSAQAHPATATPTAPPAPVSAKPVRAKSGAAASSAIEVIDATNIEKLPVQSSAAESAPKKVLTEEQRDSEIARFFEFENELALLAELEYLHKKGGQSKKRKAPPKSIVEHEIDNPFSQKPKKRFFGSNKKASPEIADQPKADKKPISRLIDTFGGIRQKWPKIFH